ncbi:MULTISPECIES: MBL fold metallo-hydrolase [Amycolatopsis]|uniref:MBL fold metallo-hydrolase n=1 Tax=Amycolatopsis albidoflavus TaxID=102226 RepID=A0ABW5I7J7_9PSEU
MTITLGQLRIDPVAELDHWPFAPADLFPAVTPEHLGEHRGDLDLSITTYLVRTPDQTVLLDAGNGNAKERPVLLAHHHFDAPYLDRLAAAGVVPEDVDVVVATHLHPDHCGGFTTLVDGSWDPTFPRARYLIPSEEYAWLQQVHASAPDGGVAGDLARTFEDSVLPVVEAGLVELIDLPYEVADGITLRALPGHTTGHLIAELSSGDQHALVSGDVLHHPFQFANLTLAQGGDADPVAAAESRRTLCELAVEREALLLPAHFPIGRITQDGDGFRYRPTSTGGA